MKVKTTYLFKCHGAWSPLWQLSGKNWFEIASHNYEANMYVSCDLGGNAVNAMFTKVLENMEKAISIGFTTKEMLYQHTMYGACVLEPQHTEKTACEKMFTEYDLDLRIQARAYEIFGGDASSLTKRLSWMQMLKTGAVMVERFGDDTTTTAL